MGYIFRSIIIFLASDWTHSFSSSGRTDLKKYSNSPSRSTDSNNVKTIFVGPGVQAQLKFKELKGREKKRNYHELGQFLSDILIYI